MEGHLVMSAKERRRKVEFEGVRKGRLTINAEAHSVLGTAYLMSGDRISALRECEVLRTLDPESADQLFNLIQD